MDWFSQLFGFRETPDAVRQYISVDGEWMTSSANGARFRSGTLTIPNLEEVKERTDSLLQVTKSKTTVREVVANVQELHKDPDNRQAIFQVASQCNLLEMVGPSVRPEEGVTRYMYDRTQGPACAIACGAGTVYRNYFVPLNKQNGQIGQIGQTATVQVDTMKDLHAELGGDLWEMKNGYLLASSAGLKTITTTIGSDNRTSLMDLVRIGVHSNVEVTLGDALEEQDQEHVVHQLYCSAMPVAYSGHDSLEWEVLGTLVLDAAYELTLRYAVENADRTGQRTVFLTLLGGGAFGNPTPWIMNAILKALTVVENAGLDVVIVSYGRSSFAVQQLIEHWEG